MDHHLALRRLSSPGGHLEHLALVEVGQERMDSGVGDCARVPRAWLGVGEDLGQLPGKGGLIGAHCEGMHLLLEFLEVVGHIEFLCRRGLATSRLPPTLGSTFDEQYASGGGDGA